MRFSKTEIISIFAVFVTAIIAVYSLKHQTNFELSTSEINELKILREEVINLVQEKAECYPGVDLNDRTDHYCKNQDNKQMYDPEKLASEIRLILFKKSYLFNSKQQDILRISGDWRPFSENSSKFVYELDPAEFMSMINLILLVIEDELKNRMNENS